MSDFKQPASMAMEQLVSLVVSDTSLEQPIKDALIKDVMSNEPSSLKALREVLSSDVNGEKNDHTEND
jgi:hypothetical protein